MRHQSKEFNSWPSLADFLLVILLFFFILWYMDRLFLLLEIERLDVIPKKPLILSLKESSGFRFESGRAALSQKFKKSFLDEVLPQISAEIAEAKFNVIEVIGHTDGVPVSRKGNLDHKLLDVKFTNISRQQIANLRSGSNADLGLLRALSVAAFIHQELQKTAHKNIGFRIYSAGPLISPSDNLVVQSANRENNRERRRIELRFAFKNL